jgi:uncharacterized small protein (DUF1192 family)
VTDAVIRQLASARLELVSDVRARFLMRATVVTALVVLAVAASVRLLADSAGSVDQQGRLQTENAALQAEVARLEAELELERATRAALDGQVAELNRRLADLERQLAFVQAQGGRARRAASSN